MYDSVDTIPAKLYFKIVGTGNIRLLSKTATDVELRKAWENIELEHEGLGGKEDKKALDIPKKIEMLWAKYEAIRLAVLVLRKSDDREMKDLLRSKGFKVTDDLDNDLDQIEKEAEALQVKIGALHLKLPKINKESSPKTSFDKVVLSYGALTGLGYIRTNDITLTEYYALIETGNEKIKALESGNKRQGNKK